MKSLMPTQSSFRYPATIISLGTRGLGQQPYMLAFTSPHDVLSSPLDNSTHALSVTSLCPSGIPRHALAALPPCLNDTLAIPSDTIVMPQRHSSPHLDGKMLVSVSTPGTKRYLNFDPRLPCNFQTLHGSNGLNVS
ncbi:hypothetical protein ACLB2K_053371 [Fragaria x ananassa]